MRVLLIAEACNPQWVSVPLEGWSHSQALRRITEAHLVTQIRNAGALRQAGLEEGKDFTAINSEAIAQPAYKLAGWLRGGSGKGWTTVTAINTLIYPFFERLVWKQFGQRIERGDFDIVHRLTPLSPTSPSFLAGRCRSAGVPFVLGPLNGGVPWPAEFDAARRKEKEWLSYVRGAYRWLPGYGSTRRNAAAILIGSRDTWKQMPERYRDKCFYVPENAMDPARFPSARVVQLTGGPLRITFVGRLVPYKGADMLIEAVAPLLREGRAKLCIIGNGPQLDELRQLIEREKVQEGIELPGWVDHTQLAVKLLEADVFAFPSIREFGGGVVLEAMAVGTVPIVMDYGGPAELVTNASGYLVPMGTRQQIIERFQSILRQIAENPGQLSAKSAAAARRARGQFTWDAKAAQVMQVYRYLRGEAQRPEFEMPLKDVVIPEN